LTNDRSGEHVVRDLLMLPRLLLRAGGDVNAERTRLYLRALLDVRSDHLCACRSREVGELQHLVAHSLGGGIRQQNADEKRPLPRLPGRDQMLSFSIRFMASAILASGAVTDSRK